MTERVLVCLSGGADSAVAASLLQEQGYEVSSITFWFWSFPDAPTTALEGEHRLRDAAERAANELGISHRTIDASERFRELVLQDFVSRYRRGETPNPCGRCNRLLRFDLAFEQAAKGGFDRVATGHHSRIVEGEGGRYELHCGVDAKKDQSYFLYGLKEEDLARLLFPVGALTKDEVLDLARKRGLSAASLPESQDLCFALAGRTDFLFSAEDYVPGPILDLDGNQLGEHRGLPRYTIGQRRGLKIAAQRPLYVVAIDREQNAVIVGGEEDLYAASLVAIDASYVEGEPPDEAAMLLAKIRYRSPPSACTFHRLGEGRFSLLFDDPQRAITPGQIAAIYKGDRLLGGGVIKDAGGENKDV